MTRVACVALLLLAGCGRSTTDTSTDNAAAAPSSRGRTEIQRGPVKLTAAVDPPKAKLSDEPKLTLTIEYEPGVVVEKPPFGESLGSFVIRDFREPVGKVREGREVMQQIYTLEPMDTGKLTIDPIVVVYTDKRANGDGKQHMIETEAITVEIESVVPGDVPSLKNVRAAAEPLEVAYHRTWPWLLAAGLLAIAAVGGVLWWRRKRRSDAIDAIVLSPEQIAVAALEQLVESRLAETDVKLFFVELTAIVRRYIEQTTGIRAPEETTEEFLREIARSKRFSAEEKQRLQNFLGAADLVKFAAYQPRWEDIDESIQRARLFIGCFKPAGAGEAAA
jgi:LPXTG-motif cell wall-anchored protein